MRRVAAIIAAVGFLWFLGIALLPHLSARPPIYPYVGMVICATLFVICDRTWARYIGIVCLLLSLIAGINLYQRNAKHDARVKAKALVERQHSNQHSP
jgi:hypothetical protein